MSIWEEMENMNDGVNKALIEFGKLKEKGILRELFEIKHNEDTAQLLTEWIDLTVIMSMQNNNTQLRNPYDETDHGMIVNGENGMKDLILKGFAYGLYWKTKEIEDAKLNQMWNTKAEDK